MTHWKDRYSVSHSPREPDDLCPWLVLLDGIPLKEHGRWADIRKMWEDHAWLWIDGTGEYWAKRVERKRKAA